MRRLKFLLSFALLTFALLALPAQGWALPPTVEINSPSNGDVFALNDPNATAAYECQAVGDAWIVFCEGDVPFGDPIDTSTPGSHTFYAEARNNYDEQAGETTTYLVAGPPSVTLNSPSEGDVFGLGWSVTPDFSCSADSVTAIDTCVGSGIDTSTPGSFTFTATATDLLGQSASVSVNYTVAAPPSVDLIAPGESDVYKQDELVTAGFSCTADSPATSISSCVGTVDDGSAIDTSSAGTKAFTVTATDGLGQTRTVTRNYTVVAPEPPVAQPQPPGPAGLKSALSGKPKLAKSGKSVSVRRVCGSSACVVTLTISIGKQRYTVRSKSLRQSTSAAPTSLKIKLPSKLTKKIKAAKKQRRKVSVTAKIAARK